MCFYVDIDNSEELVAEDDIKCYKMLHVDSRGKIFSTVYRFAYELGEIYRVAESLKIVKEGDSGRNVIGYGFHSYIDLEVASKQVYPHTVLELAVAVIPKGSRYYENETEYVSDCIQIIKEVV